MNRFILGTLFIFLVSCSGTKNEPFTFVQLCDPQLGFGGYEHDVETFKIAVEQINQLQPDFVVICGDLVHHRSDETFADFKKIAENFSIPCYNAPGNHDVGKIPNDTTLGNYKKLFGPDYYNFQHKGYSFIVANSSLWKADVPNESAKHDQWFRETLRDNKNRDLSKFVIGHFPLYLNTMDEKEVYGNLPQTKREELITLFKENKVVAYLTGHTHRKIIHNVDGIQLVCGENTSRNFDDNPLGFRIWTVSNDSITHHFKALELPQSLKTSLK